MQCIDATQCFSTQVPPNLDVSPFLLFNIVLFSTIWFYQMANNVPGVPQLKKGGKTLYCLNMLQLMACGK